MKKYFLALGFTLLFTSCAPTDLVNNTNSQVDDPGQLEESGIEDFALPYEIDSEYFVVSQTAEYLANDLNDYDAPGGLPEVGSLEEISENEISFIYSSGCLPAEGIVVERIGLDSDTLIISMQDKDEPPECGADYFLYHLVLDRALVFSNYEIYKKDFYNNYYRIYPSYQLIYPTKDN